MTVVERRIGEITILDLEGRLVFEEGDSVLRSHIDHLVSEGRRNIIVNLRDVTYVDTATLGLDAKILLETAWLLVRGDKPEHDPIPRFDEVMARREGAEDI